MKLLKKLNLLYFYIKCYSFDLKKLFRFSYFNLKNQSQYLATIAIKYHVVEKGLTMPNMRYGFGKDNIIQLVHLCKQYSQKFDTTNPIFFQSISVLKEYIFQHQEANFNLDIQLKSSILELTNQYPQISCSSQICSNYQNYFLNSHSSFDIFSASRHSIRNYDDSDIPIDVLNKAFELAQTAPSACNRQPNRIHVISDKEKITNILSIQNGNRGFGHLANKLLILTVDLSYYGGVQERNLPYIDSGIFTMNLLYSLHFYNIGACTLNCCFSPNSDKKIRDIIPIPNSECLSVIICCGNLPKHDFKIALSKRISSNSITTFHS